MKTTLTEGLIFGACNPLLDISARVDAEMLKKYDLKPNSAILGEDKHLEIYSDLKKDYSHEIDYIPGGAGQNALRTASWILNTPNVATFMGCIGKDHDADIMKQKAGEVGLNVVYQINDKVQTGRCAVLITGNDRSLVAHLGAANCFTEDHLDNEHHWSFIEKARIFYISGYFFTVCPQAIMRIAKYSHESAKTFSINLSAPFLCEFFKDRLLEAFPYVDIVFGNEDEAEAFSKHVLGQESTDIHAIAKNIANLPKLNSQRKRIAIITQGDKPVVYSDGEVIKEFPVQQLKPEQIVDTNGAGDAFVGGFLAQFIQDKDMSKCIDCGIWASCLIIQRHGCTFPDTMDYE